MYYIIQNILYTKYIIYKNIYIICSEPGGMPAWTSRSHSMNAVTDVNSDGLQTMQLPEASAGAILNVSK